MTTISPVALTRESRDALHRASAATGMPFDYLVRTAIRESGLDRDARAATSSARGMFQFIENTWLAMIRKSGHKYGLGAAVAAIRDLGGGRYDVPDRQMRTHILDMRANAGLSALMAAEYGRENAAILHRTLGRMPGEGEVYLAHFLGARGATQLIRLAEKAPHTLASTVFPAQARANRAIFYAADGSARSVGEVRDVLVGKYATALAVPGPAMSARTQRGTSLPLDLHPGMAADFARGEGAQPADAQPARAANAQPGFVTRTGFLRNAHIPLQMLFNIQQSRDAQALTARPLASAHSAAPSLAGRTLAQDEGSTPDAPAADRQAPPSAPALFSSRSASGPRNPAHGFFSPGRVKGSPIGSY